MWVCSRCKKINSNRNEYCKSCGECKIGSMKIISEEKKQNPSVQSVIPKTQVEKMTIIDVQKNKKIHDNNIVFGRDTSKENPSINYSLRNYPQSEYISSIHARLYVRNGEYILTDLDSTNGTFLNGERIFNSVKIKIGDTISLAKRVEFKISE